MLIGNSNLILNNDKNVKRNLRLETDFKVKRNSVNCWIEYIVTKKSEKLVLKIKEYKKFMLD